MQQFTDTIISATAAEVMAQEVMDDVNHGLISVGMNPLWANRLDNFTVLLVIIILALLANVICRRVILEGVAKLVKRTKATWDDVVFDHKVMIHLSRIVAPVFIYFAIPLAFPAHADSALLDILRRLCLVYVVVSSTRFANVFLAAVYHVYSQQERFRDRPLKGLLQAIQVAVFFVALIFIISVLLKYDPSRLLTGLGASAAILMLVFKDSIMSVVSGIQLTANQMLKVGDWIIMPKYEADGTVIEVTLNTVKVRNWDNSVTTIPPYALVSESFQNWQAMRESGGRRIKRSVNIDMTSVKFCSSEMMERFRHIDLLREWMADMEAQRKQYNAAHGVEDGESVNAMKATNLGAFRAYLTAYIKGLHITNTELFCFVRYLQPTEKGIPVELWFYSKVKDFEAYESIQADVMDHVLAVIPEFELKVYQYPTGEDIRRKE